MEYDFRKIEEERQKKWKEDGVYKVSNPVPGEGPGKPKFYVLDMFPYPSGAGLHVGHPLGYIASDIYSRYKRLKGFNVLHPMGFDSFGLPAEQYAIETGQHPATTTEKNIETFKAQLDKIGFCYDWDREIRTSNPLYYKWTQWIFLQLFNSYFCHTQKKALPISLLIKKYETKGAMPSNGEPVPGKHFTAEEWKAFTKKEQEDILMKRRLAFSAYGEVNWCEALGTVLANDEVVNGVSERGGHPVIKKKMRQWYLRITEYADRLLEGLETVSFSDAMKEMQRNWIGKSEGAEMEFRLTPNPSPAGEGSKTPIQTANKDAWPILKDLSRENRRLSTVAEDILWQRLRGNQLGSKVRRQHVIENFIIDFAFLNEKLLIEVDGDYHNDEEQKKYDDSRSAYLMELGYEIMRFKNIEVENDVDSVIKKISEGLAASTPLSLGRGVGGEAQIKVYTTRPDTIFGVDFLVLAPEHELVSQITSAAQKSEIENYLTYVKSRSDRERMAEVKQITGCFTGAYAQNPFDGRLIPIWIAEYVLAGYGTGAIMAVPCGDQRDFAFAKHFNIPITNIIGGHYNGEEANATKDAVLQNSGFLNGMLMKDAIAVAINKIEEDGIGKRKINYRMRDAGFSRQRYWGEPFPIIWSDGIAIPLDAEELPLELPFVEKYGPGPEGEGPLANIKEWVEMSNEEFLKETNIDLTPNPSPKERGTEGSATYGYVTSTVAEWKNTLQFAKQNRKTPTAEEDKMWQELRNRQITNCKFRRQHPIAGYIPDFVCLEKRLIIEIDGGYHNEKDQKIFDNAREEWLKESGYKMMRFKNDEVNNNLPGVLEKIVKMVSSIKDETPDNLQTSSPIPGRGVGGEVKRETSTMPGYAGSSWYFLRYMDPHNSETFCDRKASDYWNQVDVYIGGTEHAVGHLLYSRLWTKLLYDLNLIGFDEPFKKLVNQGMIQGSSRYVYRVNWHFINLPSFFSNEELPTVFISSNHISGTQFSLELLNPILDKYDINKSHFSTNQYFDSFHVDVKIVDGIELDIEKFRDQKSEYKNAFFMCEDGTLNAPLSFGEGSGVRSTNAKYICGVEVEKMSKSKYNTVNPDDLVIKYGADTFRMYEMFLGPLEQSKPWDTKGIEGVHRFLRKLWRLFYDEIKGPIWTDSAPSTSERAGGEAATEAELKVLHKTIKKIEYDTENFSFNTAVSAFMIIVNELADLKCHKKEILEKVLILLVPYAPHIAEELWGRLGNEGTILNAAYPVYDEKYLLETSKEYPISINGKMRATIKIAMDAAQPEVEQIVLQNEIIQKWLEGKAPKKIIFVKGKMVNVVV